MRQFEIVFWAYTDQNLRGSFLEKVAAHMERPHSPKSFFYKGYAYVNHHAYSEIKVRLC